MAKAGAGPGVSSAGCTAVLSWDERPAEHRPCIMTSACHIRFLSPLPLAEDDELQFASQRMMSFNLPASCRSSIV